MNINYSLLQINRILENKSLSSEHQIERISYSLPKVEDHYFISQKELILDYAKNSKSEKFRLLCTLNDNLQIFAWCDSQYNFIGIIKNQYMSEDKDYTIDYNLECLSEVINNAENWLKSVKNNSFSSGSPYLISNLQIMSI